MGKGETFTNHQFLGSMLVFGHVIGFQTFIFHGFWGPRVVACHDFFCLFSPRSEQSLFMSKFPLGMTGPPQKKA